ncbi:MAG: helix-turn-helix domain-containing protein [Lentisphaerae bacterium]|nr:helix-turn-helix domain-containing protein [Lentisphaerota bacterium]
MSTHEMRFVFQRDIRGVLDHFSRLMRVRFCFLSPTGRELEVGGNLPHCRFCRMVRHRLGLNERCAASDHAGWQRAAHSGGAVWYRCHAGLVDGCMAVRSGARVLGYMMIGQFRTRAAPAPAVRALARRLGVAEDLDRAFAEVPLYSRAQVRDLMGLFAVLVNFIVSQRLIAVRSLDPLEPLLTYLAEHPQETLSTGDAARLLHRSPSSLAHIFKEATGTSFLQYQIAHKLDVADDLFRARPGLTVREAAFELGFTDPYYFSRLYRRHRGRPPTATLRRLRGG